MKISASYMEASAPHDREWEEDKVREAWASNIRKTNSVSDLISLVEQIDDGMSLPYSMITR